MLTKTLEITSTQQKLILVITRIQKIETPNKMM